MYNEQTKGSPNPLIEAVQVKSWLLMEKETKSLSQSLISPALPDFLLLLYLQ